MKKPFIYILTAGLAVSMIANTSTTYAAETVEPLDSNATVNFEGGNLSLSGVTDIHFGVEELSKISIKNQSIQANPMGFEVEDTRGTGHGWDVYATLTSFTEEDEVTKSLPGAEIILSDENVGNLGENESLLAPNVIEGTVKKEEYLGITLVSDAEQVRILKADPRNDGEVITTAEGLGKWGIDWNKVELSVPGAVASVGENKAKIDWTFTVAP